MQICKKSILSIAMKNLEDKRINSFADDTDYKLRSCDKHCCKYAETFYIVLRALQETFLRISFSKQDNKMHWIKF